MIAATRRDECKAETVLFMALELSDNKWKVGTTVAPAQKPRTKDIAGGDLEALSEGLLKLHGIYQSSVGEDFVEQLGRYQLRDGSPLPPQIRQRLEREFQRLTFIESQIELLADQRREALRRSKDQRIAKVRKLVQLRGVGEVGSWNVVMELFAWRVFENRRQVGSLVGLTGTPSDSGDSDKEQGIDKAGNAQLRALLIEMAWNWVRWQPNSDITLWFNRKFGGSGRRSRRIGIVGVARRMLIAFWRYLEQDVEPKGAIVFKST